MPIPTFKLRSPLDPELGAELTRFNSQLSPYLLAEHTSDGAHGVIHEQGRTAALGQFVDAPNDATMFSALAPMTWTIAPANIATWAYALTGNVMIVTLFETGSVTGGTASTTLYLTIPGGYLAKRTMAFEFRVYDGTNWIAAFGQSVAGDRRLYLYYPGASGATWPLAQIHVYLTAAIEIRSSVASSALGNALGGSVGGSGGGPASNAITSLTTDVVAVGPGAAVATIQPDVVTYAKMQNVSAASRLLGRGSAAGSGDPQEVSLGAGLTMAGTVISGVGGTIVSAVPRIISENTTLSANLAWVIPKPLTINAGVKLTIAAGASLAFLPEAVGAPLYVVASHDEYQAQATHNNDSELFFFAKANAIYAIHSFLYFKNTSSTPDVKISWNIPSGATLTESMLGPLSTATDSSTLVFGSEVQATTPADFIRGVVAATQAKVLIDGVLRTGATAGLMQLKWAQNTGTLANPTIRQVDSYIEVKRMR